MSIQKYPLILLIIFSCLQNLSAQQFSHPIWEEEEKPKTLFGRQSEYLPYFAFETKYTSGLDMPWVFFGMQAGVNVNKNMTVGLAGYGLISSISHEVNTTSLDIYGGYGGVVIGAKIRQEKLFHFSLPVLIGVGNLELSDPTFFPSNDSAFTVERSACLVVEPAIELELNVTPKLRLAVGGSYRYLSGLKLNSFSDSQLRGLSSQFSIRYGKY